MIAALTDRGVLSVTGDDRVAFLQGLISQDMTKVTAEQPLYGCLLTPQGKYFADFFVILLDAALLLDIAVSRTDATLQRLNMFKLRSKVTLSDVSDRYTVHAAWSEDETVQGDLVYTDPRLATLGQRIVTQQPLQVTASLDAYHAWRIQHGVPDTADFELERTALLEANLDLLHGIAWDKGCYMGQELTARTHYRGLVKKRLLPFAFSGDAPGYDADLRLNDVAVGNVRSTANGYGMAVIKLEYAEQAWTGGVTVNGQAVELLKPDWFVL